MQVKRIADVLKSRRKELDLSVEDVCKSLSSRNINISIKTLYNYETGFRKPDAETLMTLCDIYQIEDILGAFGYRNKSIKSEIENHPLVEIYDNLNDSGRDSLLEVAESMQYNPKYKKCNSDRKLG